MFGQQNTGKQNQPQSLKLATVTLDEQQKA